MQNGSRCGLARGQDRARDRCEPGIGAAIALRLARDGANIALTYASDESVAADVVTRIEAFGRRAVAVRADSGDPAAVTAAVDTAATTFSGLDILVNNAGVVFLGPLEKMTLVQPGPTDTDANPADDPHAGRIVARTPLGRYGHVDDIADMVAYLAGPGGRHITGTTITLDGGFNA